MTRVIRYDAFKRGDTPSFVFNFTAPTVGYDWTGTTIDCAITNVEAPANNTGAAATRLAQTLTVVGDTASYTFTLTEAESKALSVAEYKVEAQLKQGANVATALTGKVKVLQDYVI